jgi:DmsE family decaheme c-type cytochrome
VGKIRLAMTIVGVLGAALWATSTRAADEPPGASYAPQGVQTCMHCHDEPSVRGIFQTKHAMKGDSRTPFAQHDCESCHGPSEQHAAGRGRSKPPPGVVFNGPHASPVAQRNAMCLTCHESGLRMNWQGSPHDQNQIACSNCHNPHLPKDAVLVRISQPQICFTCHAQQRAESFEYSHHPMREGKVVCSDCHNPHGSPADKQLVEFNVNETCYNCHADKRGPLLWEHQPVRDNCLNCHTPHGSNEARLMKERMNFLCSSCHSAESNNSGGAFGGRASIPFHSQTGSSFVNSALANQRQCINCHSQVHGSNSPSGAFFFR